MCIIFRTCSTALRELIEKYFTQLTRGCGRESCNNPDCATGSGRALSPDEAAPRALLLVQNRGQLCRAFSPPKGTPQSSSQSSLTVSSSEQSIVSQEVGVDGGRSEVTLLHSQSSPQPPTSEPMELAFSPTDIHEHSPRQLVIGSSSSSMVRPFQNRSSPSASLVSHTTSTTSSSSSSSSGRMLGPSSSSSSSSALVHMASSNMVDEVARMEVSPSPYSSPSLASVEKMKQSDAKAIPVQIGKL